MHRRICSNFFNGFVVVVGGMNVYKNEGKCDENLFVLKLSTEIALFFPLDKLDLESIIMFYSLILNAEGQILMFHLIKCLVIVQKCLLTAGKKRLFTFRSLYTLESVSYTLETQLIIGFCLQTYVLN